MSIPTMILFKDGVEKKRIIGARPKHTIVTSFPSTSPSTERSFATI